MNLCRACFCCAHSCVLEKAWLWRAYWRGGLDLWIVGPFAFKEILSEIAYPTLYQGIFLLDFPGLKKPWKLMKSYSCIGQKSGNWIGHGYVLKPCTSWGHKRYLCLLDADVPVASQIPRSESALDYFANNWLQFPQMKLKNICLCHLPCDWGRLTQTGLH